MAIDDSSTHNIQLKGLHHNILWWILKVTYPIFDFADLVKTSLVPPHYTYLSSIFRLELK